MVIHREVSFHRGVCESEKELGRVCKSEKGKRECSKRVILCTRNRQRRCGQNIESRLTKEFLAPAV
jgi:hypothetical protein